MSEPRHDNQKILAKRPFPQIANPRINLILPIPSGVVHDTAANRMAASLPPRRPPPRAGSGQDGHLGGGTGSAGTGKWKMRYQSAGDS